MLPFSRWVDAAARWASFTAAIVWLVALAGLARHGFPIGTPTLLLLALPAAGLAVLGVSTGLRDRTRRKALATGAALLAAPALPDLLALPALLPHHELVLLQLPPVELVLVLLALMALAYAFVHRRALRLALRAVFATAGLLWFQHFGVGLAIGWFDWRSLTVGVALLLLAAAGTAQARPPSPADPASAAGAP